MTPIQIIKNSAYSFCAKVYLRRWKKKTTACGTNMYMLRRYENYGLFVDLYWYLKPSASAKHVCSHYERASLKTLRRTIHHVEQNILPEMFSQNNNP